MKQLKRSRQRRIVPGAILFLLLLFSFAAAEKAPVLRISCPSRSSETVISRNGSEGLVLSIPGFWDAEKMILELDGADSLLIGADRKEIRSGEPADLREFLKVLPWLQPCAPPPKPRVFLHRV